MEELTEYEQQRLAHIERNREYMLMLGVLDAAEAVPSRSRPSAKAARKRREPQEPTRRSGRVAGAPPELDGSTLDEDEEDEDEDEEERERQVKRRRTIDSDVLADTQAWLQRSRDALLALGGGSGKAPTGADEWRAEAERRWGDKVPSMEDYESYVRSRLPTPPPPSDLQLLQEFYSADIWRLCVACSLMSRVSSHDVKSRTIAAFFARYPTPSAALDADPEELKAILHPLGLFPNRAKSLAAISQRFLEMPRFDLGLTPELKVFGFGSFGVDSYSIFCRGRLDLNPSDATLKSFVAWQKRRRAKAEQPQT